MTSGPRDRTAALLAESSRLVQEGQFARAAGVCRELLSLSPDHPQALHFLGICLVQSGQVEQGMALLKRSIDLEPQQAQYWLNYGYALTQLGDAAGGEQALMTAVRLDPRNAASHNHLGTARQRLARPHEAAESFRTATELDPRNAQAWLNLGATLRGIGNLAEAVAALNHAVRCAPEWVPAWQELAAALSKMDFRRWDESSARVLTDVLLNPNVETAAVSRVASNLALLDPRLEQFISSLRNAGAPNIPAEQLAAIAQPLLLALLENALVCNPVFENVMTAARRRMLMLWAGGGLAAHPDLLRLLCALSQQCFLSEYVYQEPADESAAVGRLADTARAGASAAQVALLAAYRPLARIAGLPRPQTDEIAFDRLWQRQVLEPAEEARLVSTIPRITPIRDTTSLAVQQQYEENPYPRWYRAPARLSTPLSLRQLVASLFPYFDVRRLAQTDSPDILIAGCGSGYHVIDVAGCLPGRILAVDLSLTSLAHTMRHCRDFGFTSLRLAQADLLELGTIGERFDLISSGGVLHHLRDPLAGWKVLVSLLKPGGAMQVSLYSELARRHIVTARELLARHNLKTDLEGIRSARQLILALNEDNPARKVALSADFYSASGFRDLLMHVQEQRFTASRLRECIESLGLEFLGFDHANESVLHRYHQRFPQDAAATSLENWGLFENDHPDTFQGMYQFWVFKPA